MAFKQVLLQTPAVVRVQTAQHLDQSFCHLHRLFFFPLVQLDRHFSLQPLARVKTADLALAQVWLQYLHVPYHPILYAVAVEDFLNLVLLALI